VVAVVKKAKAQDECGLPRYAWFGPDLREREDALRPFGKKLRELRLAAGFTQERLAVRCFLRRGRIAVLESGGGAPDLPTLLVLADRLGVSVGKFTDGLQAPVRRDGTARVRDLVTRQPGVSADELAASLGLPYLYAFEIALYLQSTGEIVSTRTGWHPATGTSEGAGKR
jgi:transcriptional regulator with XRE-family HTH domain